MIHLLFFGPVADAAGIRRLEIEAREGLCVADAWALVQAQFPEASRLVTVVALDGERLPEAGRSMRGLAAGDELVFMSMFSGG